jgi:hypothetical protein
MNGRPESIMEDQKSNFFNSLSWSVKIKEEKGGGFRF